MLYNDDDVVAVKDWVYLAAVCCCRVTLCVVAELRCVLLQSYVVCCCRVTLCVVAELRCVLLQSYVVCCCRVTLCVVAELRCVLLQSYVVCELHEKLSFLFSFLKNHPNNKILVFLHTCKQVSSFFHVTHVNRSAGKPLTGCV